jgi:hypothetical protein
MSTRPDVQRGAQIEQDLYVLALLNGKRYGTFVDIGCGPPVLNSNTFLLETEYGWTGIAVDVVDQSDSWRWEDRRGSRHIVADAASVDWERLFSETFAGGIDFLSLDLEPPSVTFGVLKMLPWQRWKPSVVAYEADAYRDADSAAREHEAESLMRSLGYSLRARLYPRLNHLLTEDVGCQDHIWMLADEIRRQTRGA